MTATARTRALTAGLAGVGLGLTAVLPAGPLLRGEAPPGQWTLAVALAVLFFVADLFLLHIEVRREAMSVTMAGLPLALGLLLLGPRELVVARLVGSAAVFGVQHVAVSKGVYNLAAYVFETALSLTLTHLLLGQQNALTVRVALVCWVVLLTTEQVMGLLIVQVISWHQGRPSALEVAGLQLSGLMISALATTGAYGLVLLTRAGPVGVLVTAVLVVVSVVAYRSYQVLHRRHQALAHVHEFVALNNERGSVVDLAGVMLDQVRALMRARTAELVLTGAGTALRLRVGEDGVPHALDEASAVEESDLARVCGSSGALLAPRKTRSRQQRA